MKRALLLVLTLMCLSGCAAGRTSPVNFQAETGVNPGPPIFTVPLKTVVPASAIPLHARKVTETLARTITGYPEAGPRVTFADAQASPEPIDWLGSRDFRVQDIELVSLEKTSRPEKPGFKNLELIMRFRDRLYRSASFLIRAGYETGSGNLVITSSTVLELDPDFPETQAFLVEDHIFERMGHPGSDFVEYYESVVNNAVCLTPTDEDRRTKLRLDSMSVYEMLATLPRGERKDYQVVVFVMDRLSPASQLEAIASGSPLGHNWVEHISYHDIGGWRAATFPLTFALDWELFYISTLYTPGRSYFEESGEKIRTGLFITERSYQDWPAFDRETASQGPLARCGFLLDTQNPEDVETIQARLKELGFLQEFEAQWGFESAQALKSFQQQSGLSPTGEWDEATQKELFWNTGQ